MADKDTPWINATAARRLIFGDKTDEAARAMLAEQAKAVRPSMSPDVLAWRRKYEIAIENGSFRTMPSVKEQFDAVREELGSSQL